MLNDMTTVRQGTVGVGAAIFEFCRRDWCVSIPINDTQSYDLVVDSGDGPKRVQVKTTRYRSKEGNFVVQLKSVRPNKTENIIRNFDTAASDYLFVLCDDNSTYLIPTCDVIAKTSLTLGKKFTAYKL